MHPHHKIAALIVANANRQITVEHQIIKIDGSSMHGDINDHLYTVMEKFNLEYTVDSSTKSINLIRHGVKIDSTRYNQMDDISYYVLCMVGMFAYQRVTKENGYGNDHILMLDMDITNI